MKARDVIAGLTMQDGVIENLDYEDADVIIRSLSAAGYQIVPVEPSEEMVRAAHVSTSGWLGLSGPKSALSQAYAKHAHRYRAMLSAAKEE